MKYQELIKRAWVITQEHRYLRAFGTLTSVFFILIGVMRVRYILPTPFGSISDVKALLETVTDNPMPWIIFYLTTVGLVYLFFFFSHILAEGGLIASIAKIEKKNIRLSFGKTFALGLHNFLPIVEYRTVTSLFDVTRFIVVLLMIRFYGRIYEFYEDTIFYNATWLFVIIGIFIAIMSFLLTYAEYDLVIQKNGIIKSIKKSVNLVIFHFSETLLMGLILGLVTLRAMINLILVFLIPIIVFYLVGFIASQASLAVALTIGGTVAIGLFWLAARIAGVLLVFTTAVWTLTYLELNERKEHEIIDNPEGEEHEEQALDHEKGH